VTEEDEALVQRIRSTLKRRKGYTVKRMFGGVCFLIHGNFVPTGFGTIRVQKDPKTCFKSQLEKSD